MIISKQRILPINYFRLITGGAQEAEARLLAAVDPIVGRGLHKIAFGRARAAIYLLTKYALRSGRTKVLLSPYTIPDVAHMVTLAGGQPVFYDFLPESTSCDVDSLSGLIDDNVAAVIITHYHVCEPSVERLRRICAEARVLLFDDCAIAFGASCGPELVGGLTDASVFSFSGFKMPNFMWGGLVTTTSDSIHEALTLEVDAWPRLSIAQYLSPLKAILRYDLATRPLVYRRVVFPMIQRRLRNTGSFAAFEHIRIESESLDSTLTSRPAIGAFAEWRHKLPSVAGWLAHRRRTAEVYRRHLAHRMVTADTAEANLLGGAWVNFPVLAPPGQRDEIVRNLMLEGYDVGRSLYPNLHSHPRFRHATGHSRRVEDLVARAFYLPTHFGVTEAYADTLGERVARAIAGAK